MCVNNVKQYYILQLCNYVVTLLYLLFYNNTKYIIFCDALTVINTSRIVTSVLRDVANTSELTDV